MQTETDSRLEYASSDPALFSDDEEDSASTDSVDSSGEAAMSLYETLSNTLSNFDVAIGSDDAWAWKNVELAQEIFAISVRLQNWKASVVWIASQSVFIEAGAIDDGHVKELLSSMMSSRPFLSSLLLSYFDDINTRLKNVRDEFSLGTSGEQASRAEPPKPLLEELDTAVQCICVQLAPIKSFAESRPRLQGVPNIKSEQQEDVAVGIEKEAQMPHEEKPIEYQSQYDWNHASSKWEFNDFYDGSPPKEEASKNREAQSTGAGYGSDSNYHSSYDWVLKKWKRLRYNHTISQWEFSDYYDGPPPERCDSRQSVRIAHSTTQTSSSTTDSQLAYAASASYAQRVGSRNEGRLLQGSYNPQNPATALHYETLDSSYYVRSRNFFQEGRLFSVLFTEPTSANAITDYNSALTYVMLGGVAQAQVRRFIVVRNKKAFCLAVPIFSYHGQGTLKSGVVPQEHAIAYSYGTTPQLLPGEEPLTKAPICIVMNESERPLSQASRIFFGIHHPVQYNVKVKDLGYVHPNEVPRFLDYWTMGNDSFQSPEVAANTAPNSTGK